MHLQLFNLPRTGDFDSCEQNIRVLVCIAASNGMIDMFSLHLYVFENSGVPQMMNDPSWIFQSLKSFHLIVSHSTFLELENLQMKAASVPRTRVIDYTK